MKQRLDVLLVERGLAESREKAKAIIMSGSVFVKGQREDKPVTTFDENEEDIAVKGDPIKYVSRGGLKLEKAIKEFGLVLEGFTCLDIGSSTGGFTDCMLQNKAAKVYAVDSGRGQLAWKLRSDERVICMEKTNFRYVTSEQIPEPIDFASADVSFISLDKILPAAYPLLRDRALMVCLIKPQFEAGREQVGKKGVVRDPSVHEEVIESVIRFALDARIDWSSLGGFAPQGLTFSPIRGPEGNIEYLLLLEKNGEPKTEQLIETIASIVDNAFESI